MKAPGPVRSYSINNNYAKNTLSLEIAFTRLSITIFFLIFVHPNVMHTVCRSILNAIGDVDAVTRR